MNLRVNIDRAIFKTIIFLIVLKFIFSYLNVKLSWWQRELTPNHIQFNFLSLPQDFTKLLEYLILPLLFFYCIKNFSYLKKFSVPFFLSLILIFLNFCTAFLNDKPILSSLQYTLKFIAPIYLFFCLIIHYEKYQFDIKKLMLGFIKLFIFLVIIALLFFDVSYNHDRNWLPIFFGSLHTHNYVLVVMGIGISYILYRNKKYTYLLTFFVIYLAFLYFGYRIRSAIAFFLVYIFAITFLMHNLFKVIWVKLLLFLPTLALLFFMLNRDFNLNEYSSGRISMYEAKYEMLKGYNYKEILFGRGKGSDYIKTDYWDYQIKNSHNDLLTFSVENGFLFTLIFLVIIFSLFFSRKRVKFLYMMIILGYLLTSVLSNGITVRTVAGYALFIVLAYIYTDNNKPIKIQE